MPTRQQSADASKRRSGWLAFALSLVARTLLCMIAGGAVWSLLPALFGWHPTVVMSGSMQPRIGVGDVIVSRPVPADKLAPGQILLVNSPDHAGQLRLHRFMRINTDGQLVLRGDANKHDDSSPVAKSAVRGVAALRVPLIGKPVTWAKSRDYLALLATVAAIAALFRLATWWQAPWGAAAPLKTRKGPRIRRRAKVAVQWLRPGPATLTRAGSIVLVLAVIGFAATSGTRAQAKLSALTTNPTNTWSAAASFGYANCTAAYGPSGTGATLAWPLDDATGVNTARDVSGNSRTGGYDTSGFVRQQVGPCKNESGSLYSLNANAGNNNSGVYSTATFNYATFSEGIWFKEASGTTTGLLIGFDNGSGTKYDRIMYIGSDYKIYFGTSPGGTGGVTVNSTSTYADGNWHFAVGTLAPSGTYIGLRLYIDGALVASNTSITTADSYNGIVEIGSPNGLAGWPNKPTVYYFKGNLAYAGVWNRALTPAEISSIYAAKG